MKFYFDTLNGCDENQKHLSSYNGSSHWIVSQGPPFKNQLRMLNLEMDVITNISNGVGCYVIDVNGDPDWWAGFSSPPGHILNLISNDIRKLARKGRIRIVIAADREGGPMVTNRYDCFRSTHNAIKSLGLPPGSVLITQGNKKIEKQYESWLKNTKEEKLFEVMHSCHFGKIFQNREDGFVDQPIIYETIKDKRAFDYNSLNRVYRTHRGMHLYRLITDNILSRGLVSANQLDQHDRTASNMLGISLDEYNSLMKLYYPRFVDGDWSEKNAANQYNLDIYRNSLITFINETIFFDDVAFLTEKIFKPLTFGHPIILSAGHGTLRALEEMGFRIDWCGIDPSYNDIIDPIERFNKTHEVLYNWNQLSKRDKIIKIEKSMDTIEHNFNEMKKRDLYNESILEIYRRSKEYFGES